MSRIVYIAGPYSSTEEDAYIRFMNVERNIRDARNVAAWCARHDVLYICPHMNSALFDLILPDVSHDHWLHQGLQLMYRCDGLLVLPEHSRSAGTTYEISEATLLNKPVFYWPQVEELLEWAKQY